MPKNDGKTPQQRFNERYTVDPVTDCWNWTAGFNGKGYAYLWIPDAPGIKTESRGKTLQAYKLAYVWKFGPVPDGMELHHTCENKKCVNPDHLEQLTQAEHLRISPTTVGGANAIKTTCPKGHQYTHRNKNGGRCCRICNNISAAKQRERKRNAL